MALNINGLEGNELSRGDYLRKSVPQSRWGDAYDVFKSNFGKLVLINLFILITFVPGIVIVNFRGMILSGLAVQYPFNSSIIYPFYPELLGLTESVYLYADLITYGSLIAAGLIAAVGISGGAYSIKKLLNTHGEFSVKGFFHGVKVCYLNTAVPITLFMAFLFAARITGDWKDIVVAQGGNSAGAITAYVFVIIATVFVGLYSGWLLAVGVSYRVKFVPLIKNSFVLLIGTPLQTVIIAGIALIPVWLFLLGGFFAIVSYVLFILFGFSYIILCWIAYTQWAFDLFIEPNVKAENERAKATKTPAQIAAEKEEEAKNIARELLAAGRSELISKPIKPVEGQPCVQVLGKTFNRAQLAKNSESRRALQAEVEMYEKQHINDPEYAEYNKMFAEREKALQAPADKKNKKKRVSADNLLK